MFQGNSNIKRNIVQIGIVVYLLWAHLRSALSLVPLLQTLVYYKLLNKVYFGEEIDSMKEQVHQHCMALKDLFFEE